MLVYLVHLFWPSWPSILPNSKTHYLTTRGSQCFRFQHLSTTTQVAWVNKCWWFCFIDPPLYKYILKKNYKSNISVYLLIWLNIFPMATLFKKRQPEREGAGRRPYRKKKPKVRQHMFLGRPLLSSLAERRDTLAISCCPSSLHICRGGHF